MHPATAHLSAGTAGAGTILMLGDGVLLGTGGDHARGALPGELIERSRRAGRAIDVDLAWDLRAALSAAGSLAASGRLQAYTAVVVAIAVEEVAPTTRRLGHLLAPRRQPAMDGPSLVVVLATAHPADPSTNDAHARIHELARRLGVEHRLAVLPARTLPNGVLADPAGAAAAVHGAAQALAPGMRTLEPDPTGSREVEVDRSLAALRGRTDDLRRAVGLAQSSFDVPYAQLNLVSRGTLRSLAFIGRSSEGLQHSLSAEAVRVDGPMIVPDTRAVARFARIPEVRGPDAIRYYVGHPVHSSRGHSIGVLCVLDTVPHEAMAGDDSLIRDLALLAEGELAVLQASVGAEGGGGAPDGY